MSAHLLNTDSRKFYISGLLKLSEYFSDILENSDAEQIGSKELNLRCTIHLCESIETSPQNTNNTFDMHRHNCLGVWWALDNKAQPQTIVFGNSGCSQQTKTNDTFEIHRKLYKFSWSFGLQGSTTHQVFWQPWLLGCSH